MNTTNETSEAACPLKDVRVIDLGQYIAGPGAAMILAELGVTVIKIEPLEGDQARHIGRYGESMIRTYSRGKQSIALDLKSEAGLEIAWRLIGDADVLIQNLRPGAVDALGLGASAVREQAARVLIQANQGHKSLRPYEWGRTCRQPLDDGVFKTQKGDCSDYESTGERNLSRAGTG